MRNTESIPLLAVLALVIFFILYMFPALLSQGDVRTEQERWRLVEEEFHQQNDRALKWEQQNLRREQAQFKLDDGTVWDPEGRRHQWDQYWQLQSPP